MRRTVAHHSETATDYPVTAAYMVIRPTLFTGDENEELPWNIFFCRANRVSSTFLWHHLRHLGDFRVDGVNISSLMSRTISVASGRIVLSSFYITYPIIFFLAIRSKLFQYFIK